MKNTETPVIRLTPESIIRSFLISRKKHLFLIGNRGMGKTTLFAALSGMLPDNTLRCPLPRDGYQMPAVLPGITTRAVPGRSVILSENNTASSAVIGRFAETLPSSGSNRMLPVAEGFFTLGIPALERAAGSRGAWASLDEIGYLEEGSPAFRDAVRNLLAHKRVLAVLRSQDTPFLSELRHRKDAFLYDLDHPVPPVGCIILASGLGKRFGSNKLMAEFQGHPLAAQILRKTAGPVFRNRLAVTRHESVARLCRETDCPCLVHDLPQRSDTVRLGLECLLAQTPDLSGCLFCPADQPLVRAESLETLVLSLSRFPDAILRLSFENKPGSPVLFSRKFFPELLRLPQGRGGSFLAQKYPEQVICIPARDSYELCDADTPEALAQLASIRPDAAHWCC